MPAISPARAANVATHAWTKLYDEIMSNTLPQCSPASVGLAQARPNDVV